MHENYLITPPEHPAANTAKRGRTANIAAAIALYVVAAVLITLPFVVHAMNGTLAAIGVTAIFAGTFGLGAIGVGVVFTTRAWHAHDAACAMADREAWSTWLGNHLEMEHMLLQKDML